ncbi:hypothetical protein ACQ4M3_09615 [Leptolyngbya sp. AN03gr2]|uniref:hypothetical protein n=1 Tax=Leptolyngbya sp. AN03gr2 TaxID=3423364 RepID=UPI003D316C0C
MNEKPEIEEVTVYEFNGRRFHTKWEAEQYALECMRPIDKRVDFGYSVGDIVYIFHTSTIRRAVVSEIKEFEDWSWSDENEEARWALQNLIVFLTEQEEEIEVCCTHDLYLKNKVKRDWREFLMFEVNL